MYGVLVDRFSCILAAIDGSDVSMKAARYAVSLAKKDRAKLAVLHLIHFPASGLMYTTESSFQHSLEKGRKEAESWFAAIRMDAEESGVDTKTEIVEDLYSVPGAIIKHSEEISADVIVVGGTGRRGFKRFFLGCVASDVVRYARCPVIVIK